MARLHSPEDPTKLKTLSWVEMVPTVPDLSRLFISFAIMPGAKVGQGETKTSQLDLRLAIYDLRFHPHQPRSTASASLYYNRRIGLQLALA